MASLQEGQLEDEEDSGQGKVRGGDRMFSIYRHNSDPGVRTSYHKSKAVLAS